MPHVPGRPNEGHSNSPELANRWGYPFSSGPAQQGPFRTAQDVLTSPNDLDLGMLEALGSPTTTTTAPNPISWLLNRTTPTAGPSLEGPLGEAPAPGSSDPAWWREQTNIPSSEIQVSEPWHNSLGEEGWRSLLPGGTEWDANNAGVMEGLRSLGGSLASAGSAAYNWAGDKIAGMDEQVSEWDDQMDSMIGGAAKGILGTLAAPGNAVTAIKTALNELFEEPSAWTGERPTLLSPRAGSDPASPEWQRPETQVAQHMIDAYNEAGGPSLSYNPFGSPISMETVYNDSMDGPVDRAINYYESMIERGQPEIAADFRDQYRMENGIDPARMADFREGAGVDAVEAKRGDFYYGLDPAAQGRFDKLAALEPGADAATLRTDFEAVEHFLSNLPSEEERVVADKAAVTQSDVDAYLKELDNMSDEDYNSLVDTMGLSKKHYKVDGKKFWEIRDSELGTSTAYDTTSTATTEGADQGPDAEMVFGADMDRIVAEVAAAKSACASKGGTWGANGCDLSGTTTTTPEGDSSEDGAATSDESVATDSAEVDEQITTIFGGLTTTHQEEEIRKRLAELGTTDLAQAIRNEFATITTPDYADNILTAHESMRTAVSDAAAERSKQLEASTTRAEGRIADIKKTLTGELQGFEVSRVEQQTALNQKVIDRTTDMELALTERLADIRTELGDQVTDEFESVAALAGTLTSSQATSSRDAMSRLGQIANMAAAARLAAPAELSAEALTSLGDLEFQIENQISQAKADTTAQINMEQASALLNETMRQGSFETEKQRALVESVLTEKLRGTVYEDRVSEMVAQALLQEDQYVRKFNEAVDQSEAQAKLQNLFGTQDYQRQLDMLNLQRGWQTADALETRGWQTDDYDKALEDQQDAALLERGYQLEDYTKMLKDQRQDYDTSVIDQMAAAKLTRDYDVADALAENAVGDDPLSQMKSVYPGVDDGLYVTAMAVAKMPNVRESTSKWQDAPPTDPDFDGTVVQHGEKYFVTEYTGLSDAEAYMRVLGEGKMVEAGGGRYTSGSLTPTLSAEDYASLRALVDLARILITAQEQARYDASGAQYGWNPGQPWDPTAAMDAVLASQ